MPKVRIRIPNKAEMVFEDVRAAEWDGAEVVIEHGTHSETYRLPISGGEGGAFRYELTMPRKTLKAFGQVAGTGA